MKNLHGKKILLIICGGIAAYKSLEVIRLLRKNGSSVKIILTNKVLLLLDDYFYEKADKKVLRFTLNNEKRNVAEYREKFEFQYPLFDKDTEKHYKLSISKLVKIKDVSCYEIRVRPKKYTIHYFKGKIYVNSSNLEMVFLDGGPAAGPYPFTKLTVERTFHYKNDIPVIASEKFIVYTDIPFFMPDTTSIIESNIIFAKPILKKTNNKD